MFRRCEWPGCAWWDVIELGEWQHLPQAEGEALAVVDFLWTGIQNPPVPLENQGHRTERVGFEPSVAYAYNRIVERQARTNSAPLLLASYKLQGQS